MCPFAETRTDLTIEAVHTTETAWVVLTPDEVYKVPRPLIARGLDQRALDVRRERCELALAAGRQLSDIHEAVVPVFATGEGADATWHFTELEPPPGTAIEHYALRMSRLPDDAFLARRIRSGHPVAPPQLEPVVRRLAAFHQQARRGPEIDAHGGIEHLRRRVIGFMSRLRALPEAIPGGMDLGRVERTLLELLDREGDRFEARVAGGYIVEGHGGLWVKNIALTDPPGFLNAVEFPAEYRYGDVLWDLAALGVGFDQVRAFSLAQAMLTRYTRHWPDEGVVDMRVNRFYKAMRVIEHGVIHGQFASQLKPGAEREALVAEARADFTLARFYPRLPFVIVVYGLGQSGKSSVARTLFHRYGFAVVRGEGVKRELSGGYSGQVARWIRQPNGLYKEAFLRQAYSEILQRVAAGLEDSRCVVIDAGFPRQSLRDEARALAEKHRATIVFVHCTANPAVLRQRLALWDARNPDGGSRASRFDAQRDAFEFPTGAEAERTLSIDTTDPAVNATEMIAAFLDLP